MTNDTVDVVLTSVQDMRNRWKMIDALYGGTRTMRAEGRKYLPQEPAESDPAYQARLERSTLFNALRKTVTSMSGKVFSKPITFADGTPDDFKKDWENIDFENNNGDVFFKTLFEDGLKYGLYFFLVDMPPSIPGATIKYEQENDIRPYFVRIDPHTLLGYRYTKIKGKHKLTQVRIYDCYYAEDGEFSEKKVEEIRVYTIGAWRIYRLENNTWSLILEGQSSIKDAVPLVTGYCNKTGFMQATPTFEDLSYLNVTHWQSFSDQRHILHVARVPILFGKNLQDEKKALEIGPNRLIAGPPESDLKYVEHTGKAIDSGRQDLQDLQDMMAILGLENLLPVVGGQTATAKSLDYSDINSPLQFMALGLADAIEQGMVYYRQFKNDPSSNTGGVKVNTDYGITLRDATDIQSLIQARIAREISSETFWRELQRRNILQKDFDPVKEKALLEKDREVDEEILNDATGAQPAASSSRSNVGSSQE